MIKYLWRWHPKVALRYLPIIDQIRKSELLDKPILEMGSGSLGIAPYLGKPITGVDVDFSGPQIDLVTKIRGSATKLPIVGQSFETVIMVDVLEHLTIQSRFQAIKEAVRVTKTLLVIATPCGNLSEEEDVYLSRYYQKIYGKSFPFYKEHLKHGLPSCEWLDATINKIALESGRQISTQVEGNINLKLHRFLMKGWMTKNFIVDIVFRKLFLLFIPIMLLFNKEPTYRKIFYVRLKK